MTAHRSITQSREPVTDEAASLKVTETFWGYIVSENAGRFDREHISEDVMRFSGIILALAAYGLWLLPGSVFSGDVVVMKLAMSVIFFITGAVLYWYANRGFKGEVQIDTARREIRFACRNSRGSARVQSRLPMADIESAFVQRSNEPQSPAHLLFRLKGGAEPLHLATGHPAEITRLHGRLSDDFLPPEERVENRLAASHETPARKASSRRSDAA